MLWVVFCRMIPYTEPVHVNAGHVVAIRHILGKISLWTSILFAFIVIEFSIKVTAFIKKDIEKRVFSTTYDNSVRKSKSFERRHKNYN